MMRRAPGFTATVLGLLIVGIGVTTAMFSILSTVVLRPLPYAEAERLTAVFTTTPSSPVMSTSIPNFLDWQAQSTSFERMTLAEATAYSVQRGRDVPESVWGANVTGEFFDLFRIAPLHGRFFDVADDRIGGNKVVVVSASWWRAHLDADPNVIGQSLRLDGEPFLIIGIAPDPFQFAIPWNFRADLWVPMRIGHRDFAAAERQSGCCHVIGRMASGVSTTQASAELAGITRSLAARYPEANKDVGARADDLHAFLVGRGRGRIWLLFAAVGLVFLAVCANVGNLLLARAVTRRGEMAARMVLGATRRRLVAQLLTETGLVFALGAVGGAALATVLVNVLAQALLTPNNPALAMQRVHVDGVALAFAIGISLLCGLTFGLTPALEASRATPNDGLKESSVRASEGRSLRLVRGGLVVTQVALSFALLVGAGVVVRSLAGLLATSPGFDPDNLVTASVLLPAQHYPTEERKRTFARDLLAKVAESPAVTAAALTTVVPMGTSNGWAEIEVEGRPLAQGVRKPTVGRSSVSRDYLNTMSIPLLRGRTFAANDPHPVTIISQSVARLLFGTEDPIGRRIDLGDSGETGQRAWTEIIGVCGDVHSKGLNRPVLPEVYTPIESEAPEVMTVVVRTPRPALVLHDLPLAVAGLDAGLAVFDLLPMRARVGASTASERATALLLGGFAIATLLLAMLGIYGLVSYSTARRTREVGIRIALGSPTTRVLITVMREGMSLLGLGLVVGLAMAFSVGCLAGEHLPSGVSFDAIVAATVLGSLGLAGTLASLLPALRATRIPPSIALRAD